MARLTKILALLFTAAVLLVVGLGVFVRFYLTDARIKELVNTEAEKALGRNIAIGTISVGLLRGIRIDDFIIKEKDGKADFVTMKSFVLNYDLLPLLKKKFVVSAIDLYEPTVRVFRDKAGTFNFESLAVLGKDHPPARGSEPGAAVPLPIALTIDRIRIEKAKFFLQDALGELPATEAEANAKIAISLGRDPSSLRYTGAMDYSVATTYGDSKPHLQGTGTFDQDQVQFDLVAQLDKEQLKVDGALHNFAKNPDITLNATGEVLNIDRLLGLTDSRPAKTAPGGRPQKTTGDAPKPAPVAGLPPNLGAHGQIKVARALYKGVTIKDFFVQYVLDKGILTIDEMRAKTFGGELNSNLAVDLNQPDFVYTGKMGIRAMQMTDLGSFLAQQMSETVSGSLESSFTFTGSGTEWEKLRQVLTADGSFSLKNGRIRNTSVTKSVATLIGLPELNDVSFQDTGGTFQIVKGGKISLNTKMNSQDIKAQTAGTVTLDGNLDLPLTLRLSKDLTARLQDRASLAKYLTDEQGETVLKMKLTGTATNPRPTLDAAGVQKTLEKKALDTLSDVLSGKKTDRTSPADTNTGVPPENEVQNLFKGLLGR